MNISIRRFHEKDITEEYLAWLNDKDYMRFSRQAKFEHSKISCIRYLESFDFKANFFFSIYINNILVATATAFFESLSNTHDLGFLVGKEFAGKGFGKGIWNHYVDVYLPSIQIVRLTGGTNRLNVPMIKLFTGSGFKEVPSDTQTSPGNIFYERLQ